jgi:hypothetical protein
MNRDDARRGRLAANPVGLQHDPVAEDAGSVGGHLELPLGRCDRCPSNIVMMCGTVAGSAANYKEQVTWRDAATGRLIAESDFFEPLTLGSLITPGFDGRVYFPTGKRFITLQVLPATAK